MRRTANEAALSPERAIYLRREKRQRRCITLCRWGFLLAFLALWEGAARLGWIDSFIFSQPSRILQTYVTMAGEDLLYHLQVTLTETLAGFLLGAAAGVVLAIVLWWSPFVSKVSEPYLVVLNSLPKIALGPVIIILAGAGTRAIVFMALAISLVVTVLEMLSGFRDTDAGAIRMARTFGATKGQVFRKVVLPYNIPTLFDSLKVNIGLSLVGVIAGEFLVSRAGLGYLIVYGGQVFRMDLVMASVIILAVLAALLYESVVLVQKLVGRRFGHA
ncbi:MAG: ABC transporter permease [Clostridia bacterium]|nr:ABC transporter permease [Clostridia bacterium]